MGRLILHIGTHKTATTSIQKFLRANDAELARRGVLYPDYRLIGAPGHYAHFGIVNAFSGAHERLTREDAQRFFRTVAQRARDHDVTILSAEPSTATAGPARRRTAPPTGRPARSTSRPRATSWARPRSWWCSAARPTTPSPFTRRW